MLELIIILYFMVAMSDSICIQNKGRNSDVLCEETLSDYWSIRGYVCVAELSQPGSRDSPWKWRRNISFNLSRCKQRSSKTNLWNRMNERILMLWEIIASVHFHCIQRRTWYILVNKYFVPEFWFNLLLLTDNQSQNPDFWIWGYRSYHCA